MSISPTAGSSQPEAPAAPHQGLQEALAKVLEDIPQGVENAKIAVSVMDGLTGEPIFERNAEERLSAASNIKLITAAAALDALGPAYHFRTEVLAEKVEDSRVRGDLILRGRGNPSFGLEEMNALVAELVAKGIRQVDGGVTVDNSFFDEENLPPHYDEQPEENASFRSPISATAFNFNSWSITIRPALGQTGPARVEVSPACDYLRVESTVSTVGRGRTRLRLETKAETDHLLIKLSGQLRNDVDSRRFRQRIPDPVPFVASAFRKSLADAGIVLRKSKAATGRASAQATVLAVHESPPLAVTIRGMGKYSNNFVAEMIFKTLGAERFASGAPATWEHAQRAVAEFLTERVGLPPGSFRVANGSGLFSSSEISARQLVEVLELAHREFRWGPDFLASLSISGADGTLVRRMSEGEARMRVRAKTGTLAAVSSLAGVAAADGRHPLLFAILVNGFAETKVGQVRDLQDQIAETLVAR